MNSQITGDVRRLLSIALHKPVGDGNVSRVAEPGWDSLKHLEFVFLLEEHFGVRLTEEEIAGLTDVSQISRLLEERIAS